jgi:hypothetical protein
VLDLVIDVVTVPVQRPEPSRFELWVASLERLGLVRTWRLEWSVRRGSMAGGTVGY